MGDKASDELERSSTENVTIVAETYGRAPTATVSSLNSQNSTEQLICKTPQADTDHAQPKSKEKRARSKSVEASLGSHVSKGGRRLVVALGLLQVLLGALLVGAGAMAVVKGAALSRVGAGLWAGCVAVVAGVVGVLAGINDCYGLNAGTGNSPLLTGFLALSLLCLACGNSAAVLAATGLHRDTTRAPLSPHTFEDEMAAWTPVLTNIALLVIASLHCLVCLLTIYHLSKRICPCFRPKRPYDHNQFDPTHKAGLVGPYVVHLAHEKREKKSHNSERERARHHELCKDLEVKLQGDGDKKKKKKEEHQYGSANSRERLVDSWLGRQQAARGRVRKGRKPPPVVLLPAHPAHPAHHAHPASTLGRMPVSVLVPPRYATLPLPPHAPPYAPPHAPLYYPVHETRIRRRRSPQYARAERRRRREGRERDSQLTRSLERIHRKRRAERERLSDAELKRTYTGLDRAYAEQFIAVCDESRSHGADQSESLTSTGSSDLTAHSHHHDL